MVTGLLAGSVVDAPAVVRVVLWIVWRSAGVVNVIVLVLSVAASAVVPARVVLFSPLLVGSAVLLSPAGLVVDVLAVIPTVPSVILRSAGVMIVVVSMSSAAGAVVVPARVVLFSTLLVVPAVLLSVVELVVDGLVVVPVVP